MLERKKKAEQSSAVIPAVLISALFGLAAGIVGMLLMLAYAPYIIPQSPYVTGGNFIAPLIQQQDGRSAVNFTINDIVSSSALIFDVEDVGEIILATKAVGSGSVLTSDGWILTHESVLTDTGRPNGKGLVAVIEGAAYDIEEAVIDSYTGIAFLRVDSSNLPVMKFGQSEDVTVGTILFAFDESRGLRESAVIDIGGLPAADLASAVRSSEKIQQVIRLSGPSGLMVGAPLLNHLGEVVAFYAGGTAGGFYAIPTYAFYRQIGKVLRDGEVSRPYLGIRFVDLSEHPDETGLSRGVKLRANAYWPAVLRNSPAAASNLREGDIIKSVNGEQVTANNSLPDILIDYDPGETVAMTIIRAGQEISIDVTLDKTL